MITTIHYRKFRFGKDETDALFQLYEATYGSSEVYRKRWKWEHEINPLKQDLSIFVALADGKIVGATTRLPFRIRLNDGNLSVGAFSVNSMVHPNFRKRGIIGELYRRSFDHYPFLLSKGTAPAMYKLLLSYGYAPVEPNTYQIKLLSPAKWLLWRTGCYKPKISPWMDIDTGNFYLVDRFSQQHDLFFARIASRFAALPVKDASYLNWRYNDIPFRKYRAYTHFVKGRISSVVVMAASGSTGLIVDLLWDRNVSVEPGKTIKFAIRYLSGHGFIKARCWSSMSLMRKEFGQQGFRNTSDTPHFSYYAGASQSLTPDFIKAWLICDGDGDSEYLGR